MSWFFNLLVNSSKAAPPTFKNVFVKTTKAKGIPTLTNFLVTNPMFRRVVLGIHKEKTETLNEIDEYFEKQLLTKEQYEEKYNAQRIEEMENEDDKLKKQ